MRTLLRHALLAAALLSLPSSAAAQNDDWYTDEGGGSDRRENERESSRDDSGYTRPSGDSGYTRPRGLPSAQSSEGWGLGLRLAYAIPGGDLGKNSPLERLTKGVLKPQIDITYGLNKSFVLGAYVALGGGFVPDGTIKRGCEINGVSCRIMMLESGLLAEYRILPGRIVNPWLGVNLGIDRIWNETKTPLGKQSLAFLGVGFGFSLGADVQLGDFGLGPLFSLQVGRYMNAKYKSTLLADDDEGSSSSGAIDKDQRAYHLWYNIGVRVRYQFRD